MIYLGRLVRSKLPGHAIQAFKRVRSKFPEAELWVVGDGYLRHELERNAPEGVRFFGRINDEDKFDLLQRAHVLMMPSVREGWGISVLEANAAGTPAVGYDVPGLRDSIVDGITGLLVPASDIKALSEAAVTLLSDRSTWQTMSTNALEWSRKFSWDDAAEGFQSFLKDAANGF
jgi:glycosyltransferase involved in cell wall biosynthesis